MIEKAYPPQLPAWLASGGDNFEVVLASEALYIRNLDDRPFPNQLNREERGTSRRQLVEAIGETLKDYRFWETDILESKQREYLTERLSAPQELLDRPSGTGLFLSADEESWVCLNTTDHLRFRFAVNGSGIESAYRNSRDMEEKLQASLPFAYSERYGFLTARPAECGTGLVLSFLVHIPGVIFSNGFRNLRDTLLKAGAILKPMRDEAMSTEGHVFIVHTAHSLGVDEERLLENAQDTISELVEMEFEARGNLMSKARYQVEDKILRGIGVLTYARMIALQEGYALANALRLGTAEGFLQDTIDLISATELYFVGQPAHLAVITGHGNRLVMDTHRADLFKEYIKTED